MVCKLFSFSSLFLPLWFRPLEFAGHSFCFRNIFGLRGFCAARQQNINGRSGAHVIDAISGPDMNTHLGDAFADRFAIAEIPQRRTRQASQDSGLRLLVGEMGEPLIEIRRSQERIQVL